MEDFIVALPPIPGPISIAKLVQTVLYVVKIKQKADSLTPPQAKQLKSAQEVLMEWWTNFIETGGKELNEGPFSQNVNSFFTFKGGVWFFTFPMWRVDP